MRVATVRRLQSALFINRLKRNTNDFLIENELFIFEYILESESHYERREYLYLLGYYI